jgi:hypothetical protein
VIEKTNIQDFSVQVEISKQQEATFKKYKRGIKMDKNFLIVGGFIFTVMKLEINLTSIYFETSSFL